MSEGNNPAAVSQPEPQQTQIRSKEPYQFSQEEIRVLKECNTESFFQRSLPLSGIFAFATFSGVKSGYLKASGRFGAIPKVSAAIFIGYFLGKISYQRKCAEKLMELPNSYIGMLLRKKKNKDFDTGTTLSMFGATSPDVYSDAGPSSSLDLDTDRPVFRGLDESTRHTLDSNVVEDPVVGKTPGMTYDELRKKNREEYGAPRAQPYKIDTPPGTVPPIARTPSEQPIRNQYGDVIN